MQRAAHATSCKRRRSWCIAGTATLVAVWVVTTLATRPATACSYAPDFVAVDLDADAAPEPDLGVPVVAAFEVRRGADMESSSGCTYTTTSCSDTGSVRFRLTDEAGAPFDGATAYLVTIEGNSAPDFFSWPAEPLRPAGPSPSEFVFRFADRDQEVDASITLVPLAANGDPGPSASVAVNDDLGGCAVAGGTGGQLLVLILLALLGRRRRVR